FISISICCGIGLFISCTFIAFNIHFRSHRYIRMSSPTLDNIILGGCMLPYINMILTLWPPPPFINVMDFISV
ncbi:unnamed protein product, partial [Rotaria sordida]